MEHEDFLQRLEAAANLRDVDWSVAVQPRIVHACGFAGQAPGA